MPSTVPRLAGGPRVCVTDTRVTTDVGSWDRLRTRERALIALPDFTPPRTAVCVLTHGRESRDARREKEGSCSCKPKRAGGKSTSSAGGKRHRQQGDTSDDSEDDDDDDDDDDEDDEDDDDNDDDYLISR